MKEGIKFSNSKICSNNYSWTYESKHSSEINLLKAIISKSSFKGLSNFPEDEQIILLFEMMNSFSNLL